MNDHPGEHIDDEGGVDESRPGRDIGEGGDPELVRPAGPETPLHEIERSALAVGRDGCTLGPAPDDAPEAHFAHQALDGAPHHVEALAP